MNVFKGVVDIKILPLKTVILKELRLLYNMYVVFTIIPIKNKINNGKCCTKCFTQHTF